MDTENLVSRRALLKGAPAAAVAAVGVAAGAIGTVEATGADTDGLYGLPLAAVHIERAVEAMADPRIKGRWSATIHTGDADQEWGFRQDFSELSRAILRHKQAEAVYDALVDREDQIETGLRDHPTYEAYPKVQYGWHLHGAQDRSPLYARTIKELDDLCERDCAVTVGIWGERGKQRSRERFAALKQDLAQRLRRRAAIEGASGLSKVRREKAAANKKLEQAVVGVFLARPRTQAEAQEKRAYIAADYCFRAPWWEVEELVAALYANLDLEA